MKMLKMQFCQQIKCLRNGISIIVLLAE